MLGEEQVRDPLLMGVLCIQQAPRTLQNNEGPRSKGPERPDPAAASAIILPLGHHGHAARSWGLFSISKLSDMFFPS